jgi:hypothetical protein
VTTTAEARVHKDAVLALITPIANLTIYDAEVPDTPPAYPDGKVKAYAVLYGGAGQRLTSSLEGSSVDMDWPFQVTCAAGLVNDCLWAVDKVCAALVDVRPVVAGRSTWRISQDMDVGPVQRDEDVHPVRFYVPLMFRLYSQPA